MHTDSKASRLAIARRGGATSAARRAEEVTKLERLRSELTAVALIPLLPFSNA